MNSINNKIVQFLNKLKFFFLRTERFFNRNGNGYKNGLQQKELDKKLVFSLAKSKWPSFKQLKYINKYLNRAERLTVAGCLSVILLSSLFLAVSFYKNHLRVMPVDGGSYIEGVMGSVKYVNPLYASFSDVDSDLTNLVYSSLFKRGENAQLVKDLAEKYEVSQDGKTYTVVIRPDVQWHNGSRLTADDLVFTFEAIKNSQYKSPLRASFTGVEMEKIDDQTVRFVLAEPYAAFLELLTFGILPQELWSQIDPASASLAELNLKPVGSGVYKFKSLVKDKTGNIRVYTLAKNSHYYNKPAHIDEISFKVFGNITEAVSALNSNLIAGISYLPAQQKSEVVAQDSLNFYQLALPKLSAVFFNTKANSALADKKTRQALAHAVDKNKIISDVMGNNASLIDGPILPTSFAYYDGLKKYNYDPAAAAKLLEGAGWKAAELTEADIQKARLDLSSADEAVKKQAESKVSMGVGRWLMKNNNYLIVELTTVDNQEYGRTADLLAKFWQAIRIKTVVSLVPANQIQTEIIKTRNFSALLYGEITGADPDPYAFWHSSQAGQAGLNIADYANKEVDKLLEESRLTSDLPARLEKYKKFQEMISEDEPAIFIYSPNYIYPQSKTIKGFNIKSIILPSDRFADVNQWYVRTGRKIVW